MVKKPYMVQGPVRLLEVLPSDLPSLESSAWACPTLSCCKQTCTRLLWELFGLHSAWETTVFQPLSSSAPVKLCKCWFPMLSLLSWVTSLSKSVDSSSVICVVWSESAECPSHPVTYVMLENDHIWATRGLQPDCDASWHVCFPGKWALVAGSTETGWGTHPGSCLVQSCGCVSSPRGNVSVMQLCPDWTCATPTPQVLWRSDGVKMSVMLVLCPALYTKSWLFLGLPSHCFFFTWPGQPFLWALSENK